MKHFTVTQTLTREQISDVLCSALEGGSNYWYTIEQFIEPTTWEFGDALAENIKYAHNYPLNPGGALLMRDYDDSGESEHETIRLDWDAIQKGLEVMAEKYPWHFANILSENADAETGDVLLQCCLFGEIVYE